MHRSLRLGIGIITVFAPLALVSPAQAQDVAAAEALFNHGLTDLEAGRYAAGCPAIAESQRLDPRAGTLFTLSQCEVRWGRVATAVTRLGDYLRLYERLTPEQKVLQGDRSKVAKEQLDKLTPEVPELTLSLPPDAPTGTVVKRDGAVVANAAQNVALPVDPGEHTVTTQAPDGALRELRFTIAKGEKKSLRLEVKTAPRPIAPSEESGSTVLAHSATVPTTGKDTRSTPTPASASIQSSRVPTWSWVAGGAGLATLGAGVAFAVDHASARRTLAADCPGDVCDSTRYSLEIMQSLRARWNRDLGLAVGLGAVGLAGVSIAAVGIAGRSRENSQPTLPAATLTPWLSPNAGGAIFSGDF